MVYVTHGVFVNGGAPAIDQTFCNDIDNCLTGNLGLAKVLLSTGSIARISKFSGVGSQTGVAHGCGGNPDIVIVQYAGSYGALTQPAVYKNTTSTTVDIDAQSAISWNALAIRFTP